MKKLFLIGLKDVKLAFRDTSALLLMLLAPFLLTIGLGFVTGRFSGSGSGVSDIPVVLVNQDGGSLGDALVQVFASDELDGLVQAGERQDPAEARRMVDEDQVAAAVIIPEGFSDSIIPTAGGALNSATVAIELYGNPTRPTSVGVVRSVLEQFLSRVEVGRAAGEVVVTQMITHDLIDVQDAAAAGEQMGSGMAESMQASSAITLEQNDTGEDTLDFDVLAYMAPGMALMFLMYTASYGGRSLLLERSQGTLPRLLVSPTTSAQVLGGKVFGIFLTGAAQVFILILTSTLLFGLQWGDPLGVVVLVLAAVFAAVGWGMLITAVAKTPGQVSWIGSAIMLTFGLLGGSFISLDNMPSWFRVLSKITPNAWGLDGFTILGLGGNLSEILLPVLALLAMGVLLFGVAVILFSRGDVTRR